MELDETRVLVVDDDVDSATTLCAILEMDGYAATAVHTGLEALDLRDGPARCAC